LAPSLLPCLSLVTGKHVSKAGVVYYSLWLPSRNSFRQDHLL